MSSSKKFVKMLLALDWGEDESVLNPSVEREVIASFIRSVSIALNPNPVGSDRIEITKEIGVAVKKAIAKIKTDDLILEVNNSTTVRENELIDSAKA